MKQIRKKRTAKGSDQHKMCVAIDNEIWPWLQTQPNKNRLINELLKSRKEQEEERQLWLPLEEYAEKNKALDIIEINHIFD